MSNDTALTTIDNPYSPFTQFNMWYSYDLEKGYDCCGYMDRVNQVDTSYLDSEQENKVIDEVIDQIVRTDPTGLYIKVKKVDPKTNKNKKDFALCVV